MKSTLDLENVEPLYESRRTGVYRRRDAEGARIIKVLKAQYPTNLDLAVYRREAELLAKVDSPHVNRLLAVEEQGNGVLLKIEDIGGLPLSEHFAQQTPRLDEFLTIAVQISRGLADVHRANIIHREVTPSNIVYNPNRRLVQIVDLGAASERSRERPSVQTPDRPEGALAYVSPEQTGRMNRSVDHRSDLYSLGATLYELLVGKTPFDGSDSLRLVYDQIARAPVPPHQQVATIPNVVSEIVVKLLEKNPEDRYQSATGLLRDLEECERQLLQTGNIEDFELATEDYNERFQLPERLYGRENELSALLGDFAKVRSGQTRALLISGASGVGKSSLVRELYRPLAEERGYFVEGKFEVLRRDEPYSAIIQALRQLVKHVLSYPNIDIWRKDFKAKLGGKAAVLTKIVPELKLFTGELSEEETSEASAHDALNRFHLTVQNFISVFTRTQPVVLFLDDLQWADAASLALLQSLLNDLSSRGLFFVGAYRDDEVGASHPVNAVLESIRNSCPITEISVLPLSRDNVRDLISDAFRGGKSETAELASIVMEKTAGNPFFIGEFLHALYDDDHLRFDRGRGCWSWEVQAIRRLGMTDNVVDLMTTRLQKLPPETQEMLKLAASVGTAFGTDTLALLVDTNEKAVLKALGPAIQQLLVLNMEDTGNGGTQYRFLHDRVQHAAYSLIPNCERQSLHLRIARLLRQNLSEQELMEQLFPITDHYNAGRSLIEAVQEKTALATMNLAAGQKAKAAGAFGPALKYFEIGTEMLQSDSWQHEFQLTHILYLERGEAELLNGNETASEELLDLVVQNSPTALLMIPAFAIRIAARNAQGRFADAIRIGIEALQLLGVDIPSDVKAMNAATAAEFERLERSIGNGPIEGLANLPLMTDPIWLAAMKILVNMTSTAYIGMPQLYPLIVAKQVNITYEHGVGPMSAVGFASYGVLTSAGGRENFETSRRFGKLSLALLDRLYDRKNEININFVFGTFIYQWTGHLRDGLEYLRKAWVAAVDLGNFEYAGYSAVFRAFHSLLLWSDLAATKRECDFLGENLRNMRMDRAPNAFNLACQVTANLRGESEDPLRLIGDWFDESIAEATWLARNDYLSLALLQISRLILHFVHGEYEQAATSSRAAERFATAMTGMMPLAEYKCFQSLALIAESAHAGERTDSASLSQVASNRAALHRWAQYSPVNFLHKALLVDAELSALRGRDVTGTLAFYEQTASKARESGFLLYEGIAYERAAAFCFSRGLERPARSYLLDAQYAFERLGAKSKVNDLRRKHSVLLRGSMVANPSELRMGVPEAGGLDLESFLKAGHVISGAVRMDNLLTELMKILLENAGAERGAIIFAQDETLTAAAQGSLHDPNVALESRPLTDAEELPAGVIRYVARTHERIVLENAYAKGPFTQERSVRTRQIRSLLCAPIMHHDRLSAIVYLENNLTTGVFTEARTAILTLLSGQIAISIDNAEVYERLEEKVRERTEQLELRNRFIRTTFGRYLSDEVVNQLLETEAGLSLGGETREVTILIADLRGFTARVEKLPPEKVVTLVNNYLGVMTDVIMKYEGTIDAFVGDGIMVIFGAPLLRPDDAERAVACALEMQLAMTTVKQLNEREGLPFVESGIGINTGLVVAGNVGSQKRAKYSVIGNTVNLAARIESCTTGGQILASESTVRQVGTILKTGECLTIQPKGASEPLNLYEIQGIVGKYNLLISQYSPSFVVLRDSINVLYGIAESGGVPHCGRVIRISITEAEVRGATSLQPFTSVRLRLLTREGQPLCPDIQGKTLTMTAAAADGCTFRVRFTFVPAEADAALRALLVTGEPSANGYGPIYEMRGSLA
jgi:predicted ATPase/class 3 adenylate cyclase